MVILPIRMVGAIGLHTSIAFISESLGHKSKQTTMNYLANFEDDEKRKWANVLLPESDAPLSD